MKTKMKKEQTCDSANNGREDIPLGLPIGLHHLTWGQTVHREDISFIVQNIPVCDNPRLEIVEGNGHELELHGLQARVQMNTMKNGFEGRKEEGGRKDDSCDRDSGD